MSRAAAVLLAFVVVVTTGTAVWSQTPAPTGYTVVASADLYSGVEYVKVAKSNLPVVAHVAHVLPGAPVDLRVINAHDKLSTGPNGLETTSAMCRRVQCIVGVNGDFHNNGVPVGAVIADGRMLRSPDPARPQLTVTRDGHLVAGPFPWTGSLTTAGTQLPVSTINAAPPANGLAVFTPDYGSPGTDASSRTELVVRTAAAVGTLNRPTDLDLVGLRTGPGPIPADGAVLSGDGSAGQQLRDLWAGRQAGGTSPVQLLVSSPVDAGFSLGAEPVVLRDGLRALPWTDPNLVNPRQPHTLVGWNKAGDTYLVAIDGRQAVSEGVTMDEAADFLLGLGVTDAVNLDGGGGTTFVSGGAVWNRPSDNDPAHPSAYTERGATNAFFVMARAGGPPPTATPPAPPPPPSLLADPLTAVERLVAPLVNGDAGGPAADPTPSPTTPSVAGTDSLGLLGPLGGVAGELALGEPPGTPSPTGGAGLPGRSPRGSSPDPSAAATPHDHRRSLVALARTSDGRADSTPPPAAEGYLRATLSLAASLANGVPGLATGGPPISRPPGPLRVGAAAAGAAALVALVGIATQKSRRRKTGPPPGFG